jgi:seryl-tRNA synthetase
VTKKLQAADKQLSKIAAKLEKAQAKRDDIEAQLQDAAEKKQGLIKQVAADEAQEADLDKVRKATQALQDRLAVQKEILTGLQQDLEAAKFETYQAERAAQAERKKLWRERYEQAMQELEDLFAQAKLCQIKAGMGGGGIEFADRMRSLAFRAKPGESNEREPASEHLTAADRYSLANQMAQEEARQLETPPNPPRGWLPGNLAPAKNVV